MTTAAKPLPPHGTYARANGSPRYRKPCNCEPCTETRNRRKKRYRINSERGLSARVDATAARQALNELHKTMTWLQIAEATGRGVANLQDIAAGRRTTTLRQTAERILAAQPQQVSDPNKFVSALGTSRRLQAMRALGHSLAVLEPLTGCARNHISLICRGGRPTVRHHVAQRIADVYTVLAAQPAPEGWQAEMTRSHARSQQWAPPAAWDDIDDPDEQPEWTGHCGTDRGYWTHRHQQLPLCQRCQQAHDDWLSEHAHLTRQELNRATFRARAQAATREADLAVDARELMRTAGLTVVLVAERLGVTKQHLQQVLLRHPAPDDKPQTDTALAA